MAELWEPHLQQDRSRARVKGSRQTLISAVCECAERGKAAVGGDREKL